MARGSGLRTAIKIVKAIDRANKKSNRELERQRKQREMNRAKREREYEKGVRQQEREDAKKQREYEQFLRQQKKEQVAREKSKAAADKARFQHNIELSKNAFEKRCEERQNLRDKFLDQELR
jgi:ATP-binding cassette subfamily B (MDR/TAP) protein 1